MNIPLQKLLSNTLNLKDSVTALEASGGIRGATGSKRGNWYSGFNGLSGYPREYWYSRVYRGSGAYGGRTPREYWTQGFTGVTWFR